MNLQVPLPSCSLTKPLENKPFCSMIYPNFCYSLIARVLCPILNSITNNFNHHDCQPQKRIYVTLSNHFKHLHRLLQPVAFWPLGIVTVGVALDMTRPLEGSQAPEVLDATRFKSYRPSCDLGMYTYIYIYV